MSSIKPYRSIDIANIIFSQYCYWKTLSESCLSCIAQIRTIWLAGLRWISHSGVLTLNHVWTVDRLWRLFATDYCPIWFPELKIDIIVIFCTAFLFISAALVKYTEKYLIKLNCNNKKTWNCPTRYFRICCLSIILSLIFRFFDHDIPSII